MSTVSTGRGAVDGGRGPAFASGSVSLRLYPHALEATAVVNEMLAQGALAARVGFDGVMVSEHHGGFGGYLPNPLQAAGWLLDVMEAGWAAACPLLLPLRPPALVAEEVAWLAARYPGRVGVGLAAGSLVDDFDIMDTDKVDLTARFAAGLAMVTGMLRGTDPGRLAGDAAIARCAEHPVPVVSGAMSTTAVRRAAGVGAGLVFDSLSSVEHVRRMVDTYAEAGGEGPTLLVRRVWIGEPPRTEVSRQEALYATYATEAAKSHWGGDEMVGNDDPDGLAERLAAVWAASGARALNMRLHAPGIPPEAIRDQIERLGAVVAALQASAVR